MLQDLKFAFRQLRRTPGVAVVAVVTLALGTGGNVALFGLLDTLVFRGLPTPDAHRLMAVSSIDLTGQPSVLPIATLAELARRQTVFTAMSAFLGNGILTTLAEGVLSRSRFDAVSGEYFDILRVSPLLGRLITIRDVSPLGGAPAHVAVISYDFWQRRYGGDPRAVGKTLTVEGMAFTIIGVTPRYFSGLEVGASTDVTVPITTVAQIVGLPAHGELEVSHAIARLQDGGTAKRAAAQLRALWPGVVASAVPRAYTAEQRRDLAARGIVLSPAVTGFSYLRERYATPLFVLVGFTGSLLLIACANLAGLLAARAAAREHELRVRLALGASRGRLLRLLLTESFTLSAGGTALGVLLAWWGARALLQFLPAESSPVFLDLTPNWRVFGVTVTIALFTGLVVGGIPAWAAGRHDGSAMLYTSRAETPRTLRWSQALLVVQVAVSFVLLAGAGLLVRNLLDMRERDHGFREDGVIVAQLLPQPNGYANLVDDSYYPALVDTLSALPGVQSAALSHPMPVTGADVDRRHRVALLGGPAAEGGLAATVVVASPRFFTTLGIPLVEGRDFSWQDDLRSTSVAILSASLVPRLSVSGSILGRHISVGVETRRQRLQIIGIAKDASITNVRTPQSLVVYVPLLQEPPPYARWPTALIRSGSDPTSAMASVRHAVESLGHEYVGTLRTLGEQVSISLARERLLASLSTFFGTLAALLVSIGLYGILSYAVARRTREFGVRMALGATKRDIRNLILSRTLWLTAAGLAMGLPVALIGARIGESTSYGLSSDPYVFAGAGALLLAVGLIAACGPARKAARVEPLAALRVE